MSRNILSLIYFLGTTFLLLPQEAFADDVNLGGSFRFSDFLTATGPDNKIGQWLDGRLRLTADGEFGDILGFEAHWVNGFGHFSKNRDKLTAAQTSSSPANRLFIDSTVGRYLNGKPWAENESFSAQTEIDRLNVKWYLPWMDITLGRQAITLGTAYFWNPLDVFQPFSSTSIDRDYKSGVDALRIDVPISDFWTFTSIYGPGSTGSVSPHHAHSLVRVYGSAGGVDMTAEVSYEREHALQAGGSITGEVFDLQIRFEGLWQQLEFAPETSKTLGFRQLQGATVVMGVGRQIVDTLSIQMEHLYTGILNDLNLLQGFAILANGFSRQASPHVTALLISYQLHPLIQTSMATLFAWQDYSVLLQGGVTWSLFSEMDVVLSGIWSEGKAMTGDLPTPQSELGSYPKMLFIQGKIYF
ncbi:MAG: hypothetical protein VYA34_09250 [Myxococcota bacterium]|nr:hypothetical protein [Myxococcota bacterium]